MSAEDAWWNIPLRVIDRMLRAWSAKAKKLLRMLRLTRSLLVLLVLLPLAAAALTIWRPEYAPYAIALVAVYVAIPLVAAWFLVGLPLKAKSIVRLIDKGYPQNAKELAIRTVARKLHDESIESEELLLETAINESRKALKKYKQRAQRLKEELDRDHGDKDPDGDKE